MCGISGIFSPKNLSDEDIQKGKQIVSQLVHRGPDNKQVFIDDNKKVFSGIIDYQLFIRHRLVINQKLKESTQLFLMEKFIIIKN